MERLTKGKEKKEKKGMGKENEVELVSRVASLFVQFLFSAVPLSIESFEYYSDKETARLIFLFQVRERKKKQAKKSDGGR